MIHETMIDIAASLAALAQQVEALETAPPPDNSELMAQIASLTTAVQERDAAIVDLQAALAACQAGSELPPDGVPLRLTGSIDQERGGPFASQTLHYRVFSSNMAAVVASGSVMLQEQAPLEGSSSAQTSQKSQFMIDCTAPFSVGDAVPVLMYMHDDVPPFDRAVRSTFFWTDAKAVPA